MFLVMKQEEKRTTGTAHQYNDDNDRAYNPVQYSKYYWLKFHLFIVSVALIIFVLFRCLLV